MKRIIKGCICIILCLTIGFTLTGCSSAELTEENVTKTVEKVETSLKEFDTKDLEKYVDSETLSYILKMAKGHDQFSDLGKAIFENLDIEIDSINLEEKTVTVSVRNKDLFYVASDFAQNLLSNYSSFQLLNKLNDDEFLDNGLTQLTQGITDAQMKDEAVQVTLTITQGKKNLVLGFDETAEDAVSGGALTAIKQLV